jgi:hypothetical protein
MRSYSRLVEMRLARALAAMFVCWIPAKQETLIPTPQAAVQWRHNLLDQWNGDHKDVQLMLSCQLEMAIAKDLGG